MSNMLTPIATVILALVCVALGVGIAEYYHCRIDQAKLLSRQQVQPDMWDLSHPTPQLKVVNTQEYARQKRTRR